MTGGILIMAVVMGAMLLFGRGGMMHGRGGHEYGQAQGTDTVAVSTAAAAVDISTTAPAGPRQKPRARTFSLIQFRRDHASCFQRA